MNYEMVVNKNHPLSKTYVPDNLCVVNSKYKDGILLEEKTLNNFKLLMDKAKSYGYYIDVMSGYRSYDYQNKIYNKLVNEKGINYAFRKIAKPGCSEHQTGLAIDFCVYRDNLCYIENEIEQLQETSWVHNNCHKYGFIVRYPKDKEDITGYDYEPWHLRYVGNIATHLFESNKVLEEKGE